ncbi:MAG: TRAP transporter small permease subunit [Bacteroidia bacterium]|nr:TRAP transporter small permease subunit [Bacteroidia bacterium]
MVVLRKIINITNKVSDRLGILCAWLLSLLVLTICVDVLLRYVFNNSMPALSEFEWHLFSFVILMGMGYTLMHHRHVRVDVFYHRFSEKTKLWIDLIGTLILLIPFCVILIKSSIPYAESSFQFNERSPDPGGLPFRWIIKYCIPIGFTLLLLQSIAWLLSIIQKLFFRKL